MKRMIVDTSNILWRVAAAHGRYNNQGSAEDRAGLALHTAIMTLRKYYNKYQPDQLAVTFEGKDNWRKTYTKSDACLSKKIYKANRVKDDSMIPIFELIKSFEDLVRNHTSLVCLSNPILEGDDIFAGYVKRFTEAGDEVIGVSGDRDFVQLLKYKNFSLINPDDGKPRTLEDVCGVDDPQYFMFEKAMRGDKGDNVFPAYPRVLKTRLKKCLIDDYELTKIMNETVKFTDPETNEETVNRVGDLFEENMLLMNLESQPDYVKNVIEETLNYELVHYGKWNFFQFTKFCARFNLVQIADNAQNFAAMFNCTKKSEVTNQKKKAIVEY